jgi:hypothetical protein
MLGAARFDGTTYEVVETNSASNGTALVIVIITSMAAAIGSGVSGFSGVVAITMAALLTWMVWVGLTYMIGTTLFATPETHVTLGELFRTTGFSAVPGILRVFGFVPIVGWPIFVGATVWMLFTFVVAVRHAFDFTTAGRAVLVCLLGWLIHAVLFFGFVMAAI